jgi:hypothetical protein
MKKRTLQWMLTMSAMMLSWALQAQTYTFVGGGGNSNWNNAANWSPAGVPTSPLASGEAIVIAANSVQNINFVVGSGASLTVNTGFTLTRNNRSLTIDGTMTNNGTLTNNVTLTISSTGTFTNNGTVNNGNSGGDNINNSGVLTNNGTINVLTGRLDNQGTGTLNNSATGVINVFIGATLRNQNDLNNNGTIINNGTVNAAVGINDLFTNNGTIVNNLTLNVNGGGTLLNTVNGTITNNNGGTLTVNATAFLINNGLLDNGGNVNNYNSITNSGTFNNNSGGVLNNGNSVGDIFDNTGILNNNAGATINNFPGATINSTNGTYNDNGGAYNGAGPLPIELLSFTGKPLDATIQLHWETASETENAYMAVERSRDGIHFQEIGQRKGAGTTTLRQVYTLVDATPLFGINYYRLRQVDRDGKPTYHPMIAVDFEGKITDATDVKLYPTVTDGTMTIVFRSATTEPRLLQILDVNGRVLHRQTFAPEIQQDRIGTEALPAGTYFATITTGTTIQTLRFVRL